MSSSQRQWAGWWISAAAFIMVAFAVRLPLLFNADALFEDDEAANALTIKHIVAGQTFALFYYGQRYQGLTEGLVALPFVSIFGWRPLAFVLSPLVAWIGTVLVAGYWLWTRWGPPWSLLWLAFHAATPVFSLWASTQAHGGHVWVVFFAVAALFMVERPESWKSKAAFWGLLFLGAYTYSYFALFLPILAAAWPVARGLRNWRAWAFGLTGAALAVLLVLMLRVVADRVQSDQNHYPDFWKLHQQVTSAGLGDRWWVFRRQCLPLALSWEGLCNAQARFHAAIWRQAVGDMLPKPLEQAAAGIALVQLLCVVVAASGTALRAWRAREVFPAGVIALGLAACLAFVLFRYGEQWSRVRYLTPVYGAVAFGTLWAMREFTRRAAGAARPVAALSAAVLATAWVVYYASVDWWYYRAQGMLTATGQLQRIESPVTRLAKWLEAEGFEGMLGYADYRLAYAVSFLTGERARLCPWDLRRIPSYADEAAKLPDPWYVALEMGSGGGRPPLTRGRLYVQRAVLKVGWFRVVVWQP